MDTDFLVSSWLMTLIADESCTAHNTGRQRRYFCAAFGTTLGQSLIFWVVLIIVSGSVCGFQRVFNLFPCPLEEPLNAPGQSATKSTRLGPAPR